MSDSADSDVTRGDDPSQRMRRALRNIRREGWKAAIIHAVVDAVALFLLANLAVSLVEPSWVPRRLTLPSPVTIPGSVGVAAVVGLGALVVGLWLRVRRPLVERFEAVNPPVAESLRTARDAVEDGETSRMAARLYEDVLDRLEETSSLGLVDLRRLTVTILVIVALTTATTQVAVRDITLGSDAKPETEVAPDEDQPEFQGLKDGDAVLGESEDVSAGDENVTAELDSTGGDEQLDDREEFPSSGGVGGGSDSVEGQQAGFAQPEQIEDAELIRKYNLRIREDSDN